MEEEIYRLHKLLKSDTRFPLDAYVFVREALSFASDVLNLGGEAPAPAEPDVQLDLDAVHEELELNQEKHLTGQELCEAIRLFALNEFGYMARVVLANWGITETGHFGDIVYNMIDVGLMKKSPQDSRSHFDDVYEFGKVFEGDFEIEHSGSDS